MRRLSCHSSGSSKKSREPLSALSSTPMSSQEKLQHHHPPMSFLQMALTIRWHHAQHHSHIPTGHQGTKDHSDGHFISFGEVLEIIIVNAQSPINCLPEEKWYAEADQSAMFQQNAFHHGGVIWQRIQCFLLIILKSLPFPEVMSEKRRYATHSGKCDVLVFARSDSRVQLV